MTEKEKIRELAKNHVGWYLESIRPLLIDNFIHGYKHGAADAEEKKIEKVVDTWV